MGAGVGDDVESAGGESGRLTSAPGCPSGGQ